MRRAGRYHTLLHFEFLVLFLSKVLGEAAPLVSKVHTRNLLGSLVVDELVVETGLNVGGTIDGVHVSPTTVLLVDGDQTLPGS